MVKKINIYIYIYIFYNRSALLPPIPPSVVSTVQGRAFQKGELCKDYGPVLLPVTQFLSPVDCSLLIPEWTGA